MNVMKYSYCYALSFSFLLMSFAHLIYEFRQGDGKMTSTSLGVSHVLSLCPFARSPQCHFIAGFDLVFLLCTYYKYI